MENHIQALPNLQTPFTMIAVKGGTFEMGGESRWDNALPIHTVEVSDFWIGEFLVTQELWEIVMGYNPSFFKGKKRPVESLLCDEIIGQCSFLEKLNGITFYIEGSPFNRPKGTIFRLPTEAEWEFAARGGNQSGSYKFSGGDKLQELGWFIDNSHLETKTVGLKLSNELGIYDMSGNLWELCNDWYNDAYYQECFDKALTNEQPIKNPQCIEKSESEQHVTRGSSHITSERACLPTTRSYNYLTYRQIDLGFRLVLSCLTV